MNKLTKVGLSALCGSLASVSAANAGTMDVLGGATATWSSNSGQVTGNPIGMASNLTFKGSGELDNGTTFALTITGADQAGYSSGSIVMTMPSMGTITISQATGGNGLGGYDDKMPTAWEESWGTSLGTGIDFPKGSSSSMNIGWKTPSFMGSTLNFVVSPRNNATVVNDKAVSGDAATYKGASYDIVLDMNPSFGVDALSGLNLFVAGSHTDTSKEHALSKGNTGDHEEGVAGITFAYGPVKVGYQRSLEHTGLEAAGSVEYYQNNAFGISFNVNDSLSLSYGEMESTRHKQGSGTTAKRRTTTSESFQIAYTVGGLSLKIAESEVDNATYADGSGSDFDATTVALSLAF
tara:strand:- start:1479 stop:2531 length:1053 start_codon:yes stop_codon:yes gene_type:complete